VLPGTTDLFGVKGNAQLDAMTLGEAYTTRVESLRDLIEVYDREVTMLERNIHRRLRGDRGYRAIQALASELLSRAATCGPSMRALALHIAAVVTGPVDRPLAIARNQQAVDLARTSGAVLIEGFALNALAVLEAAVAPASGARAQVEVMAHYLALGNHAHLRGLGRAIIVPLVDCGAFEAAGVVDGATRAKAAVLPSLIDAIKEAIDVAKNELGFGYELAARRGEQMTGDELVDYSRRAVSRAHRLTQHLILYSMRPLPMPVAGSRFPETTVPVPVREARPAVPLPSMISIDPDVTPPRLKPVDRIVSVPLPQPVTVPVKRTVLFA
jgi:hypothetical protein